MRELESQVRDLRNGRGDKDRQDRDDGERDRARDEERRRDRRKVTDNKMAETWRGVWTITADSGTPATRWRGTGDSAGTGSTRRWSTQSRGGSWWSQPVR